MEIIAFQGIEGAYSDLAARAARPEAATLGCPTFEDVFERVREGQATLGIVPIENSIAGRVADNHHLLPESRLFIVAEHFHKIEHSLGILPGASLNNVKRVLSNPQALAQCRNRIRELGLTAEPFGNTGMAAAEVKRRGDPAVAAICSRLAAELNGLAVPISDLQDHAHNTTRFVVIAREAVEPPADVPAMTTLIFRVRNMPAALYKALGGFATNGVNMTKIESYIAEGSFNVSQFYCDVEGRPSEEGLALALQELSFHAAHVRLLGTYPAHAYRRAAL